MTQIEILNIEIESLQQQLNKPNLSYRAVRMLKKRIGKLKKERSTYVYFQKKRLDGSVAR